MSDTNMMTLHTFELSLIITGAEYQACREYLFAVAKENSKRCFDDEDKKSKEDKYIENKWLNYLGHMDEGIKISMCPNVSTKGFLMRIQVNPSKVCGNQDPTAVFLPIEDSMKTLVDNMSLLIHSLPIQRDIYDFILSRLDLCKNVRLETQAHLTEYLRLFRKSADLSKWDEDTFGDERDKHSIRRSRSDYKITLYDKVFELQQADRARHGTEPFQWDQSYQILRIETALLRPGIRQQMEKLKISKNICWPDLLVKLSKSGLSIMLSLIDMMVPDKNFYSLNDAKTIILNTNFKFSKKENLIDFLCSSNRNKMLDVSKIKMLKNGKKRLRQLYELDINPVTIDARSGINMLPSVQALLLLS